MRETSVHVFWRITTQNRYSCTSSDGISGERLSRPSCSRNLAIGKRTAISISRLGWVISSSVFESFSLLFSCSCRSTNDGVESMRQRAHAECHDLVNQTSNEHSLSAGEVYFHILRCDPSDTRTINSWWAQIQSLDKVRELKSLFSRKNLNAPFHALAKMPTSGRSLLAGCIGGMLRLKCDEEIIHNLTQVYDAWSFLLNHNDDALRKVDAHTVECLESRIPARPLSDEKVLGPLWADTGPRWWRKWSFLTQPIHSWKRLQGDMRVEGCSCSVNFARWHHGNVSRWHSRMKSERCS